MIHVNITELRQRLPAYLGRVKAGEEVAVTSRGKVVARLVPSKDECNAARRRLEVARKAGWVGDVISPTGEVWEAEGDTA